MTQLAVLSGKGGTGKTSVVASFAALCDDKVLADCDVDASDLHLVLDPRPLRSEAFSGSKIAVIDAESCNRCGRCAEICRFGAVVIEEVSSGDATDDRRSSLAVHGRDFRIDDTACEGCGACALVCPARAITLVDAVTGEWYVSETRLGPLVHARLGVGQEASGKLVTVVRSEAAALAGRRGTSLCIIDGSPGIGCPVIASVTGATLALVVTEPTVSGLHDLERVASVAERLGVPGTVAINKCDLNPDMSRRIRERVEQIGMEIVGEIPYDDEVTRAQINGLSVVEYSDGRASRAIRALWRVVESRLPASIG